MKEKENISFRKHEERLYEQIAPLIRKARQQVATTVKIQEYENEQIYSKVIETLKKNKEEE